MKPLAGRAVLDLTKLLPGLYATLLLAELGAEVVKVEPPTGDPLRQLPPFLWSGQPAAFEALNRGTKSIALDLKDETDRKRFLHLAQRSDAVIEGFRPGVVKRLGVEYEAVKQQNPSSVYCALTGYGQTGPLHNHVGHDLNYAGLAGALGQTDQDRPALPGFQIGDINGGLFAALSVLGALWRREQTGEGQYLDISMTDCVAHGLGLHFAALVASDPTIKSPPLPLCGGYPFYNVYETKDGKWLSIGCLEPKFWAMLCGALGLDELIDQQFAEGSSRQKVVEALQDTFRSKSLKTWLDELDPMEVPIASVNTLREAMAHPQFQARGLFESTGVRSPIGFNQSPCSTTPAPKLGEHNEAFFGSM